MTTEKNGIGNIGRNQPKKGWVGLKITTLEYYFILLKKGLGSKRYLNAAIPTIKDQKTHIVWLMLFGNSTAAVKKIGRAI